MRNAYYTRKNLLKHQSIWAKLARASDKLKQKQENGGHSNFASIILRKIYKTLRCVYYYYDIHWARYWRLPAAIFKCFSGAMLYVCDSFRSLLLVFGEFRKLSKRKSPKQETKFV